MLSRGLTWCILQPKAVFLQKMACQLFKALCKRGTKRFLGSLLTRKLRTVFSNQNKQTKTMKQNVLLLAVTVLLFASCAPQRAALIGERGAANNMREYERIYPDLFKTDTVQSITVRERVDTVLVQGYTVKSTIEYRKDTVYIDNDQVTVEAVKDTVTVAGQVQYIWRTRTVVKDREVPVTVTDTVFQMIETHTVTTSATCLKQWQVWLIFVLGLVLGAYFVCERQ